MWALLNKQEKRDEERLMKMKSTDNIRNGKSVVFIIVKYIKCVCDTNAMPSNVYTTEL